MDDPPAMCVRHSLQYLFEEFQRLSWGAPPKRLGPGQRTSRAEFHDEVGFLRIELGVDKLDDGRVGEPFNCFNFSLEPDDAVHILQALQDARRGDSPSCIAHRKRVRLAALPKGGDDFPASMALLH